MDDFPPLPTPFGYWANEAPGWGAAEMRAYALTVFELANEAWRQAAMEAIEEHVPPSRRNAARERIGLEYGRKLQDLIALRAASKGPEGPGAAEPS